MLSRQTFDDHSLSESFYQALINCFYETLNFSTQSLLDNCTFGFAPDSLGVQTFFIITSSTLEADKLGQDLESLKNRVILLMPAVGKLAICVNPLLEKKESESSKECVDKDQKFLPHYMICKIFPIDLSNKNQD
ncbi:MAG: hypothetical protein MK289_07480 [Trichodesmium sp. ALOHA_ZT_67]|nr:hypothetical protein [Trichodesmium erythraeum GBRTRLIN201]MCH2048312.1 hypothetical protein [Trichodesmium sp. ALOHA_ZT_67]MDE5096233.1 hypothetical protein [Trichodesmium sp. St11_bin5]MDT9337938.1 hypothetical protein [Trichodesmium erythraeum 21-75]